ncbi:MAG: hypothetical protein QG599_403 [Pseudomonadota bacterium]|nr:hypothetical protein [Pseudomonadota bacterium]
MHVDLHCEDHQQQSRPFKVELLDQALAMLVEEAGQAYRIYELFEIRRPGDLWKYLWVRLIEVPETVWGRYYQALSAVAWYWRHTWPANSLPLVQFDASFCWCGPETLPEDACWLTAREGIAWQTFASRWFHQIRQAQDRLRDSRDPLIQHEIRALHEESHPYHFKAEIPFTLTPVGYTSPTRPKHAPGYYAQLGELLARPDVRSVVYGGRHDFQTLRQLCTEQQQRAAFSHRPIDGLPISLQADEVPAVAAWQAQVVYDAERPGPGDLWIQKTMPDIPTPVSPEQRCRWWFVVQDAGVLADYQRTVGAGWALYEAHDPQQDYHRISQRHYETLIERYEASPRGTPG